MALPIDEVLCCDCMDPEVGLPSLPAGCVDAVITDPPYAEVARDYGRWTEDEWAAMMHAVVGEVRRVLKPTGSAMFVLQPNSEKVGKMRPWLPVRVRATVVGVATHVVYSGFISKISVNPHINVREAYLYCTDGMDLLARQMVTQDGNTRTTMNDGTAIGRVLDASGWPSTKRSIDTDGGNIVQYPATVEF